jgi:hypothetical protein
VLSAKAGNERASYLQRHDRELLGLVARVAQGHCPRFRAHGSCLLNSDNEPDICTRARTEITISHRQIAKHGVASPRQSV